MRAVDWEKIRIGDVVHVGEQRLTATKTWSVEQEPPWAVMLVAEESEPVWFSLVQLGFLGAKVYRLSQELPTGIGAVVRLASGERFVRVDPGNVPWIGENEDGWESDAWMKKQDFEVLSEGVLE